MLDIFRGLQGLIKPHRVTIDSSIFRLHYSATTTFLLVFSIITTTRQYVGNPIGIVLICIRLQLQSFAVVKTASTPRTSPRMC